MSQENKLIIDLQLGDIIQINSPSNAELHNKIFFIKFINRNKIDLINESQTTTLSISDDGKFLEESIENIIILHRQTSSSYIIQNNLTLNKNISIYFGEPLPKVLNGFITNIEEDMMELTLIPNKEVIYIDFGYSGIPEDLNIEKIVIRDYDIKYETDEEKAKDEEKYDEKDDKDLDLEVKHLDLENKDYNDVDLLHYEEQEKLHELLSDSIDFEEELEEIFHSVNVSEDEQRYALEDQLTDYMDNMINTKDVKEDSLIKRVNLELNRYVELRTLYSEFDSNNNANIMEERGEFNKSLKEVLINLNKKLYWLLPVCINKKIIINNEEDAAIDEDYIIKNSMGEFIQNLNKIINIWSNNNSKEKVNDYKKYISDLVSIYDSNINKYDNLTTVNSQIHIVNDMYEDFYSYIVKNNNIDKDRFVIDVYNNGLKMLETYNINNKKHYNFKNLTPNDKATIISFITLPLPVFNFSKINLEYTSIYERSNLNANFLNYYQILNNDTNINIHNLEESILNNFVNSNDNIHDDKLFTSINNFSIDDNIDINPFEKHNYLLESFIPTNLKVISKLSEHIDFMNFKHLISYIQAANIDIYKLHIKDYNYIKSLFNKNINSYIDNQETLESELNKIVLRLNRDLPKESYINSFDLLNKELKTELFENYNVSDELYNNNELYQYFIKTDSAKFFMNALNKNIMDLIVANLLENFIKQSKKLEKDGSKEGLEKDEKERLEKDNSNCEKYYLSKKYNSLEDLEGDNNKAIYFDTIYDNTFYSIINEFTNEKDSKDTKQFFEFLTQKIMEKMNLTKRNALREAKAIIEEKREIIDGDYAILIDKTTNKNYIYIRQNNIWILDEKLKENFYIDSNKIFCDINKECVSKNDKCMSTDNAKMANLKEDTAKILENFEAKYSLSIEEIKGKINASYEYAKKHLKNIVNINNEFGEKTNNLLLKYNEIYEDSVVISPYEKLRDKILGLADFIKRQDFIKKFCINFTREAINDENIYWLYCNKTGVKLVPLFLLKLANAFTSKKNYLMELDTICAEQGTISDDNNNWVDKHSGYIIKSIDFSSDEGYDEQGHKLHTKDVLENDYTVNLKALNKSSNPNIDIIHSIIKSISQLIGINIESYVDMVTNNVLKIQSSSIPSKEQYEKLIIKTAKKEGKSKNLPSYEDTYNFSLLLLTLTFIIIAIQVSIPNIKSKKTFPGCIKSFTGYPFFGDQDKSTVVYIACVANKMKSSIKPWNSILKTSESTLVKKIEALIEKYVVNDKQILELLEKKKEYQLSSKNIDVIPDDISIKNWHTFLPPIIDIKINKENLTPLSETFKNDLLENITKGKKHLQIESLKSKNIYLSNAIIESIQNIVKQEAVILENNSGEPFLENACCNSLKNAIHYFVKKDKSIVENNTLIKYYNTILDNVSNLVQPSLLYDHNNTKIILPTLTTDFEEETIYKAFIYYCNFTNNLPIDDELKGVCMDKPIDFNADNEIKENIDLLKGQGKVYNKDLLNELLNIINKRNIIALGTNSPIINNIEKLRLVIDNYEKVHSENHIDSLMFNKLSNLLDTFDITNYNTDNNEVLREMKNYLSKVNNVMKNSILGFIKGLPNISKSYYKIIEENLNVDFNINYIKFFQNYIHNLLSVFPNIIMNKNVNYNGIPKHWNLSELHTTDIYNILKKYYSGLMSFSEKPELALVFKLVKNKCKILNDIINNTLYYKPINIAKSQTPINSIFDDEYIELFYTYVFYSIFNEYINITKNDLFHFEIGNYDDYNIDNINEMIINYILEFMNIMNNHYKLLNNNYKKIKTKITYSKEKEKDLITEYLKDLTDEEREIENIFKNNKLEKWGKGLQKGLTQYVKENYDEERMELEKQAVKEHLLNKKSNVTDMNKEIYKMDMEEEMQKDQEIEDEEYDMGNLQDDEGDDSDYEYD